MKLLFLSCCLFFSNGIIYSMLKAPHRPGVKKHVRIKKNKAERAAYRQEILTFLQNYYSGNTEYFTVHLSRHKKILKRIKRFQKKSFHEKRTNEFLESLSYDDCKQIKTIEDIKSHPHGLLLATSLYLKLFKEYTKANDISSEIAFSDKSHLKETVLTLRSKWQKAIYKKNKKKILKLSDQKEKIILRASLPIFMTALKLEHDKSIFYSTSSLITLKSE